MKKEMNGYTINVDLDEEPQNPRTEWDNLGTMICFHRRYNLGDKHEYRDPNHLDQNLEYMRKKGVVLPLYLYDHSGLTMSTKPFSCPWDSGQVGYIIVTKKKILEEYGGKILTKKLREKVTKILEGEVVIYDQYLRGEVYYFSITKDGEVIESCGGYYGGEEECITEAENCVKSLSQGFVINYTFMEYRRIWIEISNNRFYTLGKFYYNLEDAKAKIDRFLDYDEPSDSVV